MNEPAFQAFLNSIPEVKPDEGGKYHDDIVGLSVDRTFQTFYAYWSEYPGGYARVAEELDKKVGTNWEECYQIYLRKRRGVP
jgi:hypothetical protein